MSTREHESLFNKEKSDPLNLSFEVVNGNLLSEVLGV